MVFQGCSEVFKFFQSLIKVFKINQNLSKPTKPIKIHPNLSKSNHNLSKPSQIYPNVSKPTEDPIRTHTKPIKTYLDQTTHPKSFHAYIYASSSTSYLFVDTMITANVSLFVGDL